MTGILAAVPPLRELISIPGFADAFSSLSHLLGAVFFAWLTDPTVRRAVRVGRSAGRELAGAWSHLGRRCA